MSSAIDGAWRPMGSIRIIQGEEIMRGYLSEGISLPDSYGPNATNCTLVANTMRTYCERRHMTALLMKHTSVAGPVCGRCLAV